MTLTRSCCWRGRNVVLGLLESSTSFWQREAASWVGVRSAPARFAGAHQHATQCPHHTSATQDWTSSLSRSSRIHSKHAQHSLSTGSGIRERWSSVVAKQEDGKSEPKSEATAAEPSDREILSQLLVHIWPPDNFEFRGRVVGALALLAGSKLLNIQV